MIASWWHWYWQQSGGNVLAMPLQALITIVVTLALRKPLKKAWHRAVGEKADVDDIRRMAAAAHRISADLFEHHTGEAHPAAPSNENEVR